MGLKIDEDDCECPITRAQIEKAVNALLKVLELKKKEDFLSQTPRINIMITTHRISSKKEKKVLISLPHPLYTKSSEVCVMTKDTDKDDAEKTQDHFEEMFNAAVGYSPKIIPLRSLKKDYKSYEAKRQLSDSYDLFLGDERIIRLLPSHTGNHFYKKKKQPFSINLTASDLKKEFLNKLSSTRWLVTGNGNCSMVQVASANFSASEIADNIEASVKAIASSITRGWSNVRSLYIKSDDSLAIPLHINDDVSDDVNIKDAEEVEHIQKTLKRKRRDDLYSIKPKKRLRKRRTTAKNGNKS
ncbi:unnamed protein product [Clavelina lepadiformis]|uniref:Ribosomal protein L1 n=1 Tax=Clavelina lepadiformis TaxID=159417 RepID=A0ABP0FQW1_CLALP